MGLDMYLTRAKTLAEGGNFDKQVAYWRKANQIHRWFVENVQNGKDDCNVYEVSVTQLQTLLDLCNKVMLDKDKTPTERGLAPSLLPTQGGFFFGSTTIDQYYFDDLKATIKMLRKAIAEQREGEKFFYYSSW